MQGFDPLAVLLCGGPCFEGLIGFKSLVFGLQQVGDCVLHHVICEGDKIPSVLACGNYGQAPYIGVHLVFKVLSRWTDLGPWAQVGGWHT